MSKKSILASTPHRRFPMSRPSIRQSPHTLESNNYSDIGMESSNQKVQIKTRQRVSRSTPNSPNISRKLRRHVSKSDSETSDGSISDDSQSDDVEDAEEDDKETKPSASVTTNTQNGHVLIAGILAIIIIAVVSVMQLSAQQPEIHTIEPIKPKFPQLGDEFWLTIENGIDEVIKFNRPASFIFLYETKTETILENLLKSLSSYISCRLSTCTETPIILTDKELNRPQVVENYGILIEKYQPLLERKALMIIKHLENVSGVSAQIFHSMCDEYTPLVPKSLFIFTMKVERMPDNCEDFLERYFLEKWKILDTDVFYALFTRITSMPLKIVS